MRKKRSLGIVLCTGCFQEIDLDKVNESIRRGERVVHVCGRLLVRERVRV